MWSAIVVGGWGGHRLELSGALLDIQLHLGGANQTHPQPTVRGVQEDKVNEHHKSLHSGRDAEEVWKSHTCLHEGEYSKDPGKSQQKEEHYGESDLLNHHFLFVFMDALAQRVRDAVENIHEYHQVAHSNQGHREHHPKNETIARWIADASVRGKLGSRGDVRIGIYEGHQQGGDQGQ